MNSFQVLCVTMNQLDFSKFKEMNIQSDVIFANQSDVNAYREEKIDGYKAKMITTNTVGVGKNRNIALLYADAEICLLSDDDITYVEDYPNIVLNEFECHPNADIIIFNIDSNDGERKIIQIKSSHWMRKYSRNSFGGPRIAIRLNSIKKKNIWFTPLFGGGSRFLTGEDSMFLRDALRKRCKVYCSSKKIGKVSFEKSTWYTGFDERMFYNKGAYYAAVYPYSRLFWVIYFAFRTRHLSTLSFSLKVKTMMNGIREYDNYG